MILIHIRKKMILLLKIKNSHTHTHTHIYIYIYIYIYIIKLLLSVYKEVYITVFRNSTQNSWQNYSYITYQNTNC